MISRLPESVKQKALVLVVGFFLTGMLLAKNFVIEPYSRQLKNLYSEQNNVYLKQQLVQDISGLEKRMGVYKSAVAESKEVSWLIEELNKMAEKSALTLTSIAPVAAPRGADEDKGDYQKSVMKIETQGTYHGLGDFISRLESSSRFIKISGFHAQALVEHQKRPDKYLNASLLVSFFYPAKEPLK